MGLSIGLLQAARKRGVKIVMTTHDFYGLCLKCTFINRQGKLCGGDNGEKCAICNREARSIFFLRCGIVYALDMLLLFPFLSRFSSAVLMY